MQALRSCGQRAAPQDKPTVGRALERFDLVERARAREVERRRKRRALARQSRRTERGAL